MKVIPIGTRIAEIRKTKGLKQEALASSVGMSERKLREIETKNLPIHQREIDEIADKLEARFDEIANKSGPIAGSREIQLRPVSAKDLYDMMVAAEDLQYEAISGIQPGHLPNILDLLALARQFSEWNNGKGHQPTTASLKTYQIPDEDLPDGFDDLKLIAALNRLVASISSADIGVFANTHTFGTKRPPELRLIIAFADSKLGVVSVKKKWDPVEDF